MGISFNPLVFSGLINIPAAGAVTWKGSVPTEAELPISGNIIGDAIAVQESGKIYVWSGSPEKWHDTGVSIGAFGDTPNVDGLSLEVDDSDPTIRKDKIVLQPADETNPGAVSTTDQIFSGNKTFADDIIVEGSIDAQDGIDSTSGTLDIGVTATTINIGNSGSTVTIAGTTLYENVTDLLVQDKTITLNDGGAVDSAGNAGIEVEEDGSITGYSKVSSDRNTWELKAPGQLGVIILNGGSDGISLDESTSDLLPLDGSRSMTGDLVMDTHTVQFDDAAGTTLNVSSSGVESNQVITLNESSNSTQTADTIKIEYNNTSTSQTQYTELTKFGITVAEENAAANNNSYGYLGTNQVAVEYGTDEQYKSSGIGPDGLDLYGVDNISTESISGYLKIDPSSYSSITLSSDKNLNFLVGLGYEATLNSPLSMGTNKITDVVDPVDPQDAATKFYVDALTTGVSQVTKEPTGFPNRDDSSVSLVGRVLTITPTGTTFDVYIKGQKFTKEEESIEISTDSGNHYIYYNESGVLVDNTIFDPSIFSDNALVSIVYWNNETNSHVYFAEERHGLTMDGATHTYLHTVFGARFISGLALDNFQIDGTGDDDADAQFTSDLGKIRDEDLLIEIAQQNEIPILYRDGSLWRKKAADSYPLIYSGSAGYVGLDEGRIAYNYFDGTSWSLAEAGNNSFVLVHFFGTNDKDNGVVGVQGIAEYGNITDARNAASTEITSLSGLPFAEFVPVGSVIFETADSYNVVTNPTKARTRSIDGADYVDFRGTQLYTPAGEATTHSLLSGLANDDHTQYLLASGSRAMFGALNMGTNQITDVVDPTFPQDAATKNYVDSKVEDTIIDDVTDKAPSQNAVFDALALKLDLSGGVLTGDITLDDESSIKFTEASPGTDHVEIKAPASVSASYTLTLPPSVATLSNSALVSDASGNLSYVQVSASNVGDIPVTYFTAPNDSIGEVVGLYFDMLLCRSFEVQMSIVRGSSVAQYNLRGIYKGFLWEMSQDYIGDEVGISFTIDSTGSVLYTTTDLGSPAILGFRAFTV
jgi:hypothetical protein